MVYLKSKIALVDYLGHLVYFLAIFCNHTKIQKIIGDLFDDLIDDLIVNF